MKRIIKIILIFLIFSLTWQGSLVSSAVGTIGVWEIKAELLEINFNATPPLTDPPHHPNASIYIKFKIIESKTLVGSLEYKKGEVKEVYLYFHGLYGETKNLKVGNTFYAKWWHERDEHMQWHHMKIIDEPQQKTDNFYLYFLIIIIILMILSVIISILIKSRKLRQRGIKNE